MHCMLRTCMTTRFLQNNISILETVKTGFLRLCLKLLEIIELLVNRSSISFIAKASIFFIVITFSFLKLNWFGNNVEWHVISQNHNTRKNVENRLRFKFIMIPHLSHYHTIIIQLKNSYHTWFTSVLKISFTRKKSFLRRSYFIPSNVHTPYLIMSVTLD